MADPTALTAAMAAAPDLTNLPSLAAGAAAGSGGSIDAAMGNGQTVAQSAAYSAAGQALNNVQTATAGHPHHSGWGFIGSAVSGIKSGISAGVNAIGEGLSWASKPLQRVQQEYRYVHAVAVAHGPLAALGQAWNFALETPSNAIANTGKLLEGKPWENPQAQAADYQDLWNKSATSNVSWGRDLAHLIHFDPALGSHHLVSGTFDALGDVAADPVMVVGKAKAATDAAKYALNGSRSLEDAYKAAPQVKRAVDAIAEAKTGAQVQRIMPSASAAMAAQLARTNTAEDVFQYYADHMQARNLLSTDTPRLSLMQKYVTKPLATKIVNAGTSAADDNLHANRLINSMGVDDYTAQTTGVSDLSKPSLIQRVVKSATTHLPLYTDPANGVQTVSHFDPAKDGSVQVIRDLTKYGNSNRVANAVADAYANADLPDRLRIYKNVLYDTVARMGLADQPEHLAQFKADLDDKIRIGGGLYAAPPVEEAARMGSTADDLSRVKVTAPDGTVRTHSAAVWNTQTGPMQIPQFNQIRDAIATAQKLEGGLPGWLNGQAFKWDDFAYRHVTANIFKRLALFTGGFALRVGSGEALYSMLDNGVAPYLRSQMAQVAAHAGDYLIKHETMDEADHRIAQLVYTYGGKQLSQMTHDAGKYFAGSLLDTAMQLQQRWGAHLLPEMLDADHYGADIRDDLVTAHTFNIYKSVQSNSQAFRKGPWKFFSNDDEDFHLMHRNLVDQIIRDPGGPELARIIRQEMQSRYNPAGATTAYRNAFKARAEQMRGENEAARANHAPTADWQNRMDEYNTYQTRQKAFTEEADRRREAAHQQWAQENSDVLQKRSQRIQSMMRLAHPESGATDGERAAAQFRISELNKKTESERNAAGQAAHDEFLNAGGFHDIPKVEHPGEAPSFTPPHTDEAIRVNAKEAGDAARRAHEADRVNRDVTQNVVNRYASWLQSPAGRDSLQNMMRSSPRILAENGGYRGLALTRLRALRGAVEGNSGPVPGLLEAIEKGELPGAKFFRDLPLDQRPLRVPGSKAEMGWIGGMDRFFNAGHHKIMAPIINNLSRKQMYIQAVHTEMGKLLPHVEQGMYTKSEAFDLAEQRAMTKMVTQIHNPKLRSQFHELTRNVAPFFFAQEQAYRRWGRLVQRDPLVLRKLQLLHSGMKNSGFVSGPPGQEQLVYPASGFVGDVAGQISAHMPGLGGAGANGIPLSFTGNMASLASVVPDGQKIPLGGPVFSVPLKVLEQFDPAAAPFVNSMLDPMDQSTGIWQDWIPNPTLKNLAIAYLGGDGREMASAQMFAMQSIMYKHPEYFEDPIKYQVQLTNALTEARHIAKTVFLTKAVLGEGLPASPNVKIGYQQFSDELQADIQKYGSVAQAIQHFEANHPGKDMTPFTVFQSKTLDGPYVPPSQPAIDFFEQHSDLLKAIPQGGAYLIPQSSSGNADARKIYNEELAFGLRKKKTPEEFLQDIQTAAGNAVYYKYHDEYEQQLQAAQGDRVTTKDLQQKWSQFENILAQQNPTWGQNFIGNNANSIKKTQAITQLTVAFQKNKVPLNPFTEKIGSLLNDYQEYQSQIQDFQNYKQTKGVTSAKRSLEDNWQLYLRSKMQNSPELSAIIHGLFIQSAPDVPSDYQISQ